MYKMKNTPGLQVYSEMQPPKEAVTVQTYSLYQLVLYFLKLCKYPFSQTVLGQSSFIINYLVFPFFRGMVI